jgi:tetratricopeptide (TPR) repeat protein
LINRGLVIEPPSSGNPLESFANKSSSDEWSDEGNRLLNHREFEEAILAFDNAGDVYMRAVAAAYQSRENARDVPESQTRRRREAFMNSASAFEYCAEMTKSAEERSNHYGAAARCYAEIKYHQDAVRAFKLANMFTEAASYSFDHNLLDTAVSIIKKHEVEVDSQTKDCIKEVARLSYLEKKRLE